ncbi:MAG TPA: hypothetical protein VH572_04320 [Gaiella sp.]|jgi:hypothetical protein
MTDHVVRLYAAAAALVAFFLAWAGIAARPWSPPPRDPQLAALDRQEQRLRRDLGLAQQVVDRRWAAYRATLAGQRAAAAVAARPPAPPVRVVTLPPVATTRSS